MELDTQFTHGEEGYVKMLEEIGMMAHKPKHAKDFWQSLEARKGKKIFLPRSFRGSIVLPTT